MDLLAFAFVAVVLGAILFFGARSDELFVIAIRHGEPRVVRGHVPPGFLADVRHIVPNVSRGTIRVTRADGFARLTASGVSERALQRLRNAFSVHPASRLRADDRAVGARARAARRH
jgi:hypothetical protein